jgi:hypothetical protein
MAYALLPGRDFQSASPALKVVFEKTAPSNDEGLAYLYAWTLVETGRPADTEPLLRPYPVPPASGVGPLMTLPR